ncbi:hypothetical protein BD626DRAFT_484984 [Schizophyllum amplum]|uniref:CFEM domain-containing protein n=1 Tax=Schizophyllum amplum TaxID=97359 RepID=A0A550CQV6_9AGAR|nr:hypothetical protein BD626DRAFT_484984 [Auriculariopsis ampla]
MRFATTILFALPLLVAARSHIKDLTARQSLPDCYFTCAAAGDMGDCSPTDNTCLCENKSFIDSVTSCLQTTCSSDDELDEANAGAQEICKSVGVTLTSAEPSSTGSATSSSESAASTAPSDSDDSSDSGDSNSATRAGAGALAGLIGVGLVAWTL